MLGSESVIRLSEAERRHRKWLCAQASGPDVSPIGEDLLWLVFVALVLRASAMFSL